MRFIGIDAIADDSDDSLRMDGDSFTVPFAPIWVPSFRRARPSLFSSTSNWPG